MHASSHFAGKKELKTDLGSQEFSCSYYEIWNIGGGGFLDGGRLLDYIIHKGHSHWLRAQRRGNYLRCIRIRWLIGQIGLVGLSLKELRLFRIMIGARSFPAATFLYFRTYGSFVQET